MKFPALALCALAASPAMADESLWFLRCGEDHYVFRWQGDAATLSGTPEAIVSGERGAVSVILGASVLQFETTTLRRISGGTFETIQCADLTDSLGPVLDQLAGTGDDGAELEAARARIAELEATLEEAGPRIAQLETLERRAKNFLRVEREARRKHEAEVARQREAYRALSEESARMTEEIERLREDLRRANARIARLQQSGGGSGGSSGGCEFVEGNEWDC